MKQLEYTPIKSLVLNAQRSAAVSLLYTRMMEADLNTVDILGIAADLLMRATTVGGHSIADVMTALHGLQNGSYFPAFPWIIYFTNAGDGHEPMAVMRAPTEADALRLAKELERGAEWLLTVSLQTDPRTTLNRN